MTQLYTFDGLDDFTQTAEDLPDVQRHEVYAHREEDDAWAQLPYRDSLWTDDGDPVGDVSASERYYNIIQYGEVIESVATALEPYTDTLQPKGHLLLSDSGHKMSGYIDFDGITAEPADGDVIDLGLQVRTGHTGFHGLKYDVGAERQVCSNGMMAFVSDLHFEQTHQEPLNYGLAKNAVDAIVDGVEVVEDRLEAAGDQRFVNEDEALLVLLDQGLDAYFEDPVSVLRKSLQEELAAGQRQPTLYDTYNAATRAITHGGDLTTDRREEALERAGRLLDAYGHLPESDDLGRAALEHRVEAYTGDEAVEPYWDGEEQTLQSLLEVRGDAA